jgi:putative transposase
VCLYIAPSEAPIRPQTFPIDTCHLFSIAWPRITREVGPRIRRIPTFQVPEMTRVVAYDPSRHHRRTIRLKGYDYSQTGAYFVTICVQDRRCLFGEIVGDGLRMNEGGRMVARWSAELPNKFPTIEIGESIVMPNHFHGIVVITEIPRATDTGVATVVGAPLCGRPIPGPRPIPDPGPLGGGPPDKGRPRRAAPTLGDVVDWFKR